MDLAWDDRRLRQFTTNVGLITTNGRWGHNIMSAEWTHHISYAPSLIQVNVHDFDATADNILDSKEFGVNLAAENQATICSIAGGSSGKQVDKISVSKEMGVKFYNAKKIDVLMLEGAAMNAECKLLKHEVIGDHILFIGEVVEVSADENIKPLVYHNAKFWRIGGNIQKPPQEILDKIKILIEKHKKSE